MILKTFQRRWPIDRSGIRRFIHQLWPAGVRLAASFRRTPDTELTIVFLNDKQMRDYNCRYRNKDQTTDVLSFPVNERTPEGRHYLGDILISMDRTDEQARLKQHSPGRELKILILHGVLHLLGYDHETDKGQMNRLESKMRKELKC